MFASRLGRLFLVFPAALFFAFGVQADTTRIACVGNSITYGYGLPDTKAERDSATYSALLKRSLRTNYMTRWIPTLTDTVIDCGVNSVTLQKKGDVPSWTNTGFSLARNSRANIVTIALGTNDSKPKNWSDALNSSTQFPIDYQAMIDTFAHMATAPQVFAVLPPACSNNNIYGIHDSVLSKYIIPRIQSAAAAKNIPVIDVHTPFIKHVNYTGSQAQTKFWFTPSGGVPDGVHPLDTGHRELADVFYESIVNSWVAVTPTVRNTPFRIQFLWYGYAPNATGNDTLSKPMLSWFPAPDSINTGVSALVVPGGGYAQVADTEGVPVALWLNQHGISAFVLRYRFAGNNSGAAVNQAYYYPVPMWDVARAMRLIRYRASTFKIDTTKIGVIGFSAGGHLASWLETHYDGGNPASPDSIEQKKNRPDWAFLLYPMVTMESNYVYSPGRNYLLGSSPAQSLVDSLSNERWVTPATPPTFLDYGANDNLVNPKNSTQFDSALKANSVAQKLMTESGKGHGFAMNAKWPDTALTWLKSIGILPVTATHSQVHIAPVAAPDFSVAVSHAGLLISSRTMANAKFSIYSPSGRRLALYAVPAGKSVLWRPTMHGVFVVRMTAGTRQARKTVVFQ